MPDPITPAEMERDKADCERSPRAFLFRCEEVLPYIAEVERLSAERERLHGMLLRLFGCFKWAAPGTKPGQQHVYMAEAPVVAPEVWEAVRKEWKAACADLMGGTITLHDKETNDDA